MKHYLSILLFFLVLPTVFSQTFAPDGSYWRYCVPHFWWGTQSPHHLEISQKDTVDGKEIIFLSGNAEGLVGQRTYAFHVTGDTTYVYNPQDSSFTLLFNFSFSIGDTLQLNVKNAEWPMLMFTEDTSVYVRYVIYEKGTETIQGTDYRFYRMKYDSVASLPSHYSHHYVDRDYKVVEQIGIEGGFIMPVFYGGAWDGAYPNLFYYTNNQHPDFYGDSAGVCVLGINNPNGIEASVFPNPAKEVLNIKFSQNETVSISIINLQGKTVRDGIKITGAGSIGIHDLAPGLYVLRYAIENGGNSSVRFLKQ